MLMLSLFWSSFFSFFFFLSRQAESTQGWMLNPSLHLDHLKQNTQEINSLTSHNLNKIENNFGYNHQSMQKVMKHTSSYIYSSQSLVCGCAAGLGKFIFQYCFTNSYVAAVDMYEYIRINIQFLYHAEKSMRLPSRRRLFKVKLESKGYSWQNNRG